jgi:hypothetical protein
VRIGDALELERAELLVDDLPDYLVGRHGEGRCRNFVKEKISQRPRSL